MRNTRLAEDYGFIRVSRKMFVGLDLFWSEKRVFSRAEAWVDLIALAGWRDREQLISGVNIKLLQGQLLASERFLSERWKWSRGRVKRFLELLEKIERVALKTDHEASHLGAIVTIVNYKLYQASRLADEPIIDTTDRPGADHLQATRGPKRKNEEELKRNEEAVEGDVPRSARADAPPAEPLLTFRCIRGKKSHAESWALTPEMLAEWEATFREMDILAEARKARAWTEANGLKTYDGMPAFLVSWFTRGQNSGKYERRAVGHPEAPKHVSRQTYRKAEGEIMKWVQEILATYPPGQKRDDMFRCRRFSDEDIARFNTTAGQRAVS